MTPSSAQKKIGMFVLYAKGNISSYRLYLGSCIKITTIILLTPIPISSTADHQIG